jgi:hypothetical protein
MVERSIAWLVRGGNRKVRYRGIVNNDLWLHHRLAGLNLRRLLNLGPRPPARNLGAGLTRPLRPPERPALDLKAGRRVTVDARTAWRLSTATAPAHSLAAATASEQPKPSYSGSPRDA